MCNYTLSVALLMDSVRKRADRTLTLAESDRLRDDLESLWLVRERVVDGARVALDAVQMTFVKEYLSRLIHGCPKLDEVMAVFGLGTDTVFVDVRDEEEIGFDL